METENQLHQHRPRRRNHHPPRNGEHKNEQSTASTARRGPAPQHRKFAHASNDSTSSDKDRKPQHHSQKQKSLPRRRRHRPVKAKAERVPRNAAEVVASLTSQPQGAKNARSLQTNGEEEIWNVEVCQIAMRNSQVIAWTGPVKVLVTLSEMVAAVQEIFASGETHLGFDTETRPNYVKGGWNKTALVQLATADVVYLFRICMLPGHSFDPLLPILTNPNISKTGVSIDNDVRDLQKVRNFAAAGFVDTTTITRDAMRIKQGGLQALTYHFLGGRLAKGAAQMSDWATVGALTAAQIRYAATDAWVSREVHVRALAAVVPAQEFG